jgi:serine/threonine protein kinase
MRILSDFVQPALVQTAIRTFTSMSISTHLQQFAVVPLQVYDLKHGRALGAGSFGTVRVVTHKNSGKEFALKTVEIKGLKDAAQFNLFMNEVEIMKASRCDLL